jgi:hypothetical protein
MGYDDPSNPGPFFRGIADRALALLRTSAAPIGLFAEVSSESFAGIYRGSGRNEPETPLAALFPRGEHLALFAVTLGPELDREIAGLFARHEYPLGAALDAAASEAAERAADVVERRFAEAIAPRRRRPGPSLVLRYSPGYCGWHVSGQAALFATLHPGEVGIELRESFLMQPLKSISGVLVDGPPEIHEFDPVFPFCSVCESRDCRRRIHAARRASPPGSPKREEA